MVSGEAPQRSGDPYAVPDPYAVLGQGYAARRLPDPRVAAAITAALGDATTVVNVGAGAGSYEPDGREVVAVEPSSRMIAQRPPAAAPAVRAYAEHLPFRDRSFDAGLAVLTVHHWTDAAAGLAELRRVSRRQVVLTWDPALVAGFWLVRDYLPEVAAHERGLACLDAVCAGLEAPEVLPVPVPADCVDGFLGAYWRRPEAYLSARVRTAMSGLALLDPGVVAAGITRLAADLADGTWHRRHGRLLELGELDLGYRLVVSGR
ncbi:methyltransferase domain-containing protein [Amycolatopsis sp. H20-H5]|uniref:methyltransferase domain-containing protein n=1 Tax=Amycolatopsis sp. H20-H5 TaxID=3046309 RepID=UPI002DB86CA5|nr:methyltransferase domain-containing protein [Amycolatopsis sp. H20-H5]MEC3977132.1 methyltransferase domain-containing protein [Amycolatopsis sp. H20-H5]